MDAIIFRIYLWASRWAVRQTITDRSRLRGSPRRGRFTKQDVRTILNRTWSVFDGSVPGLPQVDVSTRRVLLLAYLTHALFRALLEAGLERDYAIELTADTIWRLYSRMYRLSHFLNNWFSTSDRAARMRVSARKAFNHLPSSYEWQLTSENDGISFEMLRCPVAEYFRMQGASDLCVGAWCNQDYGLAEVWGGWLGRDGTLASGLERCDFRFLDVTLTDPETI